MTLSKKDCEALEHLIPLYVQGLLSEKEQSEIQAALSDCPDFKNELEKWRQIGSSYQEIKQTMPLPSANTFQKVLKKTQEPKRLNFFQRLFQSPKFSMALVAAQALIILALGVYAINLQKEYRTLSARGFKAESPYEINVVFQKNANEEDIRNLLLQVNAKFVDGPYRSGLYVLGVPSREELDKAMEQLRESSIVAIAEKSY